MSHRSSCHAAVLVCLCGVAFMTCIGQGDNFGLGDMNPQFFFSPKAPFHGWIWGAGPQWGLRFNITLLFPK
jgi:hypothetical protein